MVFAAPRRLFFFTVFLILAFLPAAAPAAVTPDVSVKVLCEGTPFATPCYTIDSGKEGPTVYIGGGTHGDEPAGAAAADEIRSWKIERGKLIVVPRHNQPGLAAHTRLIPAALAPANERDLNRDYPSDKKAPIKGPIAKAIWDVVEKAKPDWVLDLHEGAGWAKLRGTPGASSSVGSSVIAMKNDRSRREAQEMVAVANSTVVDEKHKFVLLSSPIEGSLARCGGERLGACSMTVETSARGEPLSTRVRQHRLMVHHLLTNLKMITHGPDVMIDNAGGRIRLALYDDDGASPRRGLDGLLAAQGDIEVRWIGSADIQAGALGQFDVLMMPGGGGKTESTGLGSGGADAIRRFIRDGHGYVGICAGAYLGSAGFPWSLGLVSAKTVDYNRGKAVVKMELTEAGRRLLGDKAGVFDIHYANGPILGPAGKPDLPAYTVLGTFLSAPEKCEHTPKAEMKGTPTMVSAPYGKGRAMLLSPHPEATPGVEVMVLNAVRWVAGRDPKPLTLLPPLPPKTEPAKPAAVAVEAVEAK